MNKKVAKKLWAAEKAITQAAEMLKGHPDLWEEWDQVCSLSEKVWQKADYFENKEVK
jgi:hypothetical protein